MGTEVTTISFNYECLQCDTKTNFKKDYEKHLLTAKHLRLTKGDQKLPLQCTYCNKKYNSRNGLWKHSKICNVVNPVNPDIVMNTILHDNEQFKNLIIEVVKNNTELQKQNIELQKQVLDVCKNSNTNINSNNNSNNKTFNLQFFLNEQCKDAMNLSDFMNSFELELSDLESIGELGYVEGITKIMVDRLNAMDIYKRPVHCSDAKRETLYVKNEDRWEKEARNNPKLRYAIKTASFQSMKLTVLWSDTYPESKSSESRLNDKYMKLVFESTGGTGEIADSEDKIIRRILKEIIIAK